MSRSNQVKHVLCDRRHMPVKFLDQFVEPRKVLVELRPCLRGGLLCLVHRLVLESFELTELIVQGEQVTVRSGGIPSVLRQHSFEHIKSRVHFGQIIDYRFRLSKVTVYRRDLVGKISPPV